MEQSEHILLGVSGSPVLHSRSPLMFRAVLQATGIKGAYIRCAARNDAEVSRLITELGFSGMNITAPFKEKMIPHLDSMSDDAKTIGAVNTIIRGESGFNGFNTDHQGVTEPLEISLGSLSGRKAVILGAGGAGIAASYGLKQKGAEVLILNRFREQGEAAASRTGSSFKDLEKLNSVIGEADIIINTIPYEIGALDISGIRRGAILFDAGYKKSHYSGLAEKLGFTFIGGDEWLAHQGIHACGHLLGYIPQRDLLLSAIKNSGSRKSIISLTGFMASGKSSTGRALAERVGYEFADTDSIIEEKTSMSINEIFKNYGEERFREIESDVLLSFRGKNNLIISCGGGAVLRDVNREFLMEETVSFWLYTSMEESLRRGSDGTRPLLKNMKSPEELRELFNMRKHLYASLYGTLVIAETNPDDISELIHEEIRLSL